MLDPLVALQQADLETTISDQYLNDRAEKGTLENVDNMGRNISKDPPDLAAARATYFKFEIEVNKQNVNKLLDGEAGRQEVLAKARAFVSGIPFDPGFTIPPEALLPTGGVGVFDPAVGGTVYTNNFQAALKADPNQFPGTDPVVIVLTRLPDPDSQVGSEGVIPGYPAFPLAYNVEVNRPPLIVPPDPGVLVALCVVTDYLPDGVFDQLVLGHKTGPETGETWTPAIKYGELSELLPDLYCGDAVADPPASALAAAEMAPEWLKFAGRLLEPVAERMLDVQPLDAYFAGTGLGGRGNSVSPFAAVLDNGYTLDVTGSGDGIGSADIYVGSGDLTDYYSCGYNPTYGMTFAESTEPCQILVPDGEFVLVQANANTGFLLGDWTGCSPDGDECGFTMEGDLTVNLEFVQSYHLALTIEAGNGQVTSIPDGISCVNPVPPLGGAVCEADFAADAVVDLRAAPDAGFTWGDWSVDDAPGGLACSRGGCRLTMDQDHDVLVSFVTVSNPDIATLTVEIDPGGADGSVTSGTVINCAKPDAPGGNDCSEDYTVESVVNLSATASPTAYLITYASYPGTWVCPVPRSLGETCTTTIAMDADKGVLAKFGIF